MEFIEKWGKALKFFEDRFGGELDVQAIIFLIGVQELGKGAIKFSKDEKLDVMHIAICKLLSFYGYYELQGSDENGWPHWNRLKKLPPLNETEQEHLMKESIINLLEEEYYDN